MVDVHYRYSGNTVDVHYRYSGNTVDVQYRYSRSTVGRYSSNTAEVQ